MCKVGSVAPPLPKSNVMINKISIILTSFLILTSCKKDDIIKKDETGAIIEKQYVWKKTLTENQWVWAGEIEVPIFEEKFITATHFKENAKLASLDIFTGETKWEWNDYIGKDKNEIFLSLFWPYFYENILIFQNGPRSYCIDMSNGQTVWKMEEEQGFHTYLTGTEEEFLSQGVNGDTMGYEIHVDFVGDIYTGEKYPLPPPANYDFMPGNPAGIAVATNGGTLFEANGKKYLLSSYAKGEENWEVLPLLGLYNRTEDRWEYSEKQILPKHQRNTIANFPIISDDIVVTSVGYHICANDLWTGDSIWAYDCGGGFDTGGFFVHEGRIYTLAKQAGLYCLDLYTGKVIWRQTRDKIGYGSKMAHHNGVIYTTNSGLVALEMETGEFIWHIGFGEGYKEVAVYPGKEGQPPLVLTATYQNAYCYEAVR